jgi:hypothetical protein
MTMTDDNCTNGCFRQHRLDEVKPLLDECATDAPNFPALADLYARLLATPCALLCERHDKETETCN